MYKGSAAVNLLSLFITIHSLERERTFDLPTSLYAAKACLLSEDKDISSESMSLIFLIPERIIAETTWLVIVLRGVL